MSCHSPVILALKVDHEFEATLDYRVEHCHRSPKTGSLIDLQVTKLDWLASDLQECWHCKHV